MSSDYDSIWETLDLDTTIKIDETILSESALDWRDTLRSSLPHLPMGTSDESQFELAGVIGRGGMGTVHQAHQRSLSRDVAIKTVTSDAPSRQAENALLQEARVMGMVEHPNVVPVHIIGQDDRGRPIIVMKRIDGTRWADYIDGLEEPPDDDPLEFHLDVVRAVCRALSFAHDRGVLHRDIKPENVMIGRFGEVYLLDWGLAVAIDDEHIRIPLAATATEVVGTPAFMAPEMTCGDTSRLGVRTDIFLVGATLYHAVTGEPPNKGGSIFEVLSFSYSGKERDYTASTPAELRELCERAMAHDPEDRFESVDELREAIDSFLSHRASHTLVEDARKRLFALRDAIVEGDVEHVQTIFGEARFGFVSALRIWDDNVDAIEGLQATIGAMIGWELGQENIKGARALYGQLPREDAELLAEIDTLADDIAKREAKLEKIAYDYDETVGITERRSTIASMGVFLLVAPLLKWLFVDGWTVPEPLRQISADPVLVATNLFGLAFIPVFAFMVYLTISRYADHKSSRIFTTGLLVMYVFSMGARTSSLWADVELYLALSGELALISVGLFSLGLAIDRRLGRAAFIATATIFFVIAFPQWAIEIYCIGVGLSCIAFASFRRRRPVLPWSDS